MENVNEIIDNICNKLGTTAEFIAPEYARMHAASSITAIVISIVAIIAYFIILRKLFLLKDECRDFNEIYEMFSYIGGVIAFAAFLLIVFKAITLAEALASPYGYFFQKVIGMIR